MLISDAKKATAVLFLRPRHEVQIGPSVSIYWQKQVIFEVHRALKVSMLRQAVTQLVANGVKGVPVNVDPPQAL